MDPESGCWRSRRGVPGCCEGDLPLLLQLPDVRQAHPHSCGEAAVSCLMAYHQVRGVVRFATPTDGADPRQLEAALRRAGLQVVSGEMETTDLAHYANTLRPTIALVWWPGQGDSHYVCVRGVSRGRVYYHDVETGPGNVRIPEWEFAWSADGRLGETFRRWGIVAWPT